MKKKITGVFIAALFIAVAATAQKPDENAPGRKPGSEERLKHVTEKLQKDLSLTADQQQKVTAAFKEFFDALQKQMPKPDEAQAPPPPPANKDAVKKLAEARDAKIKTVLTADQFAKYMEIEKQMRPGQTGKPPAPAKQ